MSLPASPYDGQLATLRLGSGQAATDVWLRWNASRSKWVGEYEFEAVRCADQVGVVLTTADTTKRYLPGNSEHPTYAFDALSFSQMDTASTAGLLLEYCSGGWLQAPSGATWNVGTYFYQYSVGNGNTPTGVFSGGYGTPPTGGQAETAYLSTSSTSRVWVEHGWTNLLAIGGGSNATFTKPFIYPAMYAYLSTGTTSGTVWDYFLKLRWVF